MSTESAEHKSYGEHKQETALKGVEKSRRAIITAGLDRAYNALAKGEYTTVGRIAYDRLRPLLDIDVDNLDEYDGILDDRSRWYWEEVYLFTEDGDWYIDQLETPGSTDAKRIIDRALQSYELIAGLSGVIDNDLRRTSEVYGYKLQLGKLYQPWGYNRPERIEIVDTRSNNHPPFTIVQGLPGYGKSTSVGAMVEDRYAAGNKIIDMLDFTELENGQYDIPSQKQELLDVRADLGLPLSWEQAGMDRPNIQILVPITKDLADRDLPFNAETDEFDLDVFSIPASELDRKSLSMFMGHRTTVQDQTIDKAFQNVKDKKSDWTLGDLSEEIDRVAPDNGVAKRLKTALATLQQKGFIRDKSCPYAIDWEDIMRDTSTITVFSMSLLDEGSDKLMVMSYLMNAVYDVREEYKSLPRATLVFREFHRVAPTREASEQDELERDLQKRTAAAAQTKLGALHRHENLEVLCDTQEFSGQIKKRVRKFAETVVSFRGQYESVDDAFSQLIGGRNDTYIEKIAREFDTGVCAVLGKSGSDRPFEMPIAFAPPISHVYDANTEESGWDNRVNYLSNRVWKTPAEVGCWNLELPEEFVFWGEDVEPEWVDGEVSKTTAPLRFARERLAQDATDDDWEFIDDVVTAYEAFCEEHGVSAYDRSMLSRKIGEAGIETRYSKKDEKPIWWGVRLVQD